MQGAKVQTLVREPDPTCHNEEFASHNTAKDLTCHHGGSRATTKTQHRQINIIYIFKCHHARLTETLAWPLLSSPSPGLLSIKSSFCWCREVLGVINEAALCPLQWTPSDCSQGQVQRSDVDSCGPWEPQSKRKNVAGWALRLVDIQMHPYSGDQGASPIPPARDETGGY